MVVYNSLGNNPYDVFKKKETPASTQGFSSSTQGFSSGGGSVSSGGSRMRPAPKKKKNPFTTTEVTGVSNQGQTNYPNGVEIMRASNGEMTGVKFPDGREFYGLNEQQTNQLLAEFNNTPEQKARAELQNAEIKKRIASEAVVPPINNEQLSQVGQINESIANEPNATSQEIARKAEARIKENFVPGTNIPSPMISPNKMIQPISAGLKKIFGVDVVDIAGQNREIREYLQDYSMEDEYDQINNGIQDANAIITKSITDAKNAKTDIEEDEAIKNYNAGWSRLLAAQRQLKAIENSDQREYTNKIRTRRMEIENIINGNIKNIQDDRMRKALQKINTDEIINNDMTGGVQ